MMFLWDPHSPFSNLNCISVYPIATRLSKQVDLVKMQVKFEYGLCGSHRGGMTLPQNL